MLVNGVPGIKPFYSYDKDISSPNIYDIENSLSSIKKELNQWHNLSV